MNYVRQQVINCACYKCDAELQDLDSLYTHMDSCLYYFDMESRLADTNLMFPTIEDDTLLMIDNFDES